MARAIIAIDLDNFVGTSFCFCCCSPPHLLTRCSSLPQYVGVERILDPGLYDKPVGIRQKGILATCSYEARALGVSKLMGLREAKDKCTSTILL